MNTYKFNNYNITVLKNLWQYPKMILHAKIQYFTVAHVEVSDCEILRHHDYRAYRYYDCENYHDYHIMNIMIII